MIKISDKSKCCGCNACVQRCPRQCIKMHEDAEGFLYPEVDESGCNNCDLCEKVCPMLNRNEPQQPISVYAAKNNDEEQRLRSSSGGIFILLAKRIISQGGVVFGARFDEKWEVEHCYAETLEECTPLMRSKYVQSRIGNCYVEAERFLKQGRKVLFVGTSCQIAGLHKFLRKVYDNLLTVDFICHGVPSPGVWRNYLEEIKSSRSEAAGKNTVLTDITFREKQLGGYSWGKYGFVVLKSPTEGDKKSVLLSSTFQDNVYMKAFLGNFILRPSCYSCVAKQGESGADITIADFWGINEFHPEFNDDKGVGLVFIHTNNGAEAWEQISAQLTTLSTTVEDATKHNSSYLNSVGIPPKREIFWKTFRRTKSLETAYNAATRYSFVEKVIRRLKKLVKQK